MPVYNPVKTSSSLKAQIIALLKQLPNNFYFPEYVLLGLNEFILPCKAPIANLAKETTALTGQKF